MALNWDNIIITTDEYSYSIDAEQRMIIFSGAPGSAGPAGPQGPAATIAVGTTTTLPAGSNATVENVGTDTAAVFNFGIPRGSSGGGGGGDAMWGEIGGTLSDQTDLQSALDGKAAANHNHDDRYLTEAETVQAINYKISLVTDELGTMAAVNDAPSDSKTYGRKNGAWTEVTGGSGGSTAWGDITGTLSAQTDLNTALGAKADSADLGSMAEVDDAPSDGSEYVRKNGSWAVSSGGGGGGASWGSITGTLSNQTDLNSALGAKANTADLGTMASEDDAPSNGAEYVRKNGDWSLSNMGLMAEWGHVSGTLADQTDLNTALGAKANTADLGDLATQDTVDYATDVTNKPTLGSIAAANYTISSTDLTDGTSPLTTGDLYFYYEA